jgi:hypothetical protein
MDVSEERVASIFRVEEKKRKFASEEPVAPTHPGSSLADFLLFSSTLKMEAIRSSKRRLTQYLHGAISQKTVFFITCLCNEILGHQPCQCGSTITLTIIWGWYNRPEVAAVQGT